MTQRFQHDFKIPKKKIISHPHKAVMSVGNELVDWWEALGRLIGWLMTAGRRGWRCCWAGLKARPLPPLPRSLPTPLPRLLLPLPHPLPGLPASPPPPPLPLLRATGAGGHPRFCFCRGGPIKWRRHYRSLRQLTPTFTRMSWSWLRYCFFLIIFIFCFVLLGSSSAWVESWKKMAAASAPLLFSRPIIIFPFFIRHSVLAMSWNGRLHRPTVAPPPAGVASHR